MAGLLSHIRVRDPSRITAGSWCSQLLADLGASVQNARRRVWFPDDPNKKRQEFSVATMTHIPRPEPDTMTPRQRQVFESMAKGRRSVLIGPLRNAEKRVEAAESPAGCAQ